MISKEMVKLRMRSKEVKSRVSNKEGLEDDQENCIESTGSDERRSTCKFADWSQ